MSDLGSELAPSPGVIEDIDIKSVFIGAGCNRIVNNVSWGPCGLVSFGAQNAVALFHPQTAQILTTLPGHKAVVNCTKWLPSCKDPTEVQNAEKHYLLSGSADGVILVWHMITRERQQWGRVQQMPEAHKKGVTCIAAIFTSLNSAVVASSSCDGMVLVWQLFAPSDETDCRLSCVNCVNMGSKPVVTLSLSELPGQGGTLLLAMSGLDHKVHLYSGDSTGKFLPACTLKGHTDWIRSLDFSLPVHFQNAKATLYLASSSQDKTIRIWKIISQEKEERKEESALRSFIEGPRFTSGSASYQVSLESLLIGHEDWVYSVQWHPLLPGSTCLVQRDQSLSILSASMDKTMMIWRPEKTTGIWVNAVTVGELSHCALGFYGAHWGPNGDSILAHGYGGSFHLWNNAGCDHENWIPKKVPSGHFGAVSDVSWARSGEYFLSVSHDQTARIFAPCVDEACGMSWHEIARPQVHGHDINCLAVIEGEGNYQYVSGADEKVARVFEAPLSFLKSLKRLSSSIGDGAEDLSDVQILGANMSALGLSQKPIYALASKSNTTGDSIGAADSLEYVPDAAPTVLTEPPVEDRLAWHTLWPESHKLYGHGNELISLCCDHAGRLVASSCRAQSASVAEIWLWEVGTWRAVGRLPSHNLTVTQMEFSPDDSLLLAVSRDRHFSIFSIDRSGSEVSSRLLVWREAHKRIIWACAWNPIECHFATGSRDKSVKLWAVRGEAVTPALTLPLFGSGVTALAWAVPGGHHSLNSSVLAVGMESGLIELWSITGGGHAGSVLRAEPATRIDPLLCHVARVSRLRWREVRPSGEIMELASCGTDNCVRVLQVCLRRVLV
ncbi:elongator protein 2 isoform X3 [Wolffia australiana]